MNKLKIKIQQSEEYLKFKEVLQLVNTESLNWSLLYLEARGNLGRGNSLIDLEKKINKSENGLRVDNSELTELSNNLDEIVDILMIGATDVSELVRYECDATMYQKCECTVEMVDSDYWLITTSRKYINL